jgi:putative SOS response-associated peptidase YedK
MCGRYVLKRADLEALLRKLGVRDPREFADRFNVAPTTVVPALRRRRGAEAPEVSALQWGLAPLRSGAARLANARAEGIATRPTFRDAFRHRRCVVPASGFYEWRTIAGRKFPWYFTRRDGAPLLFAGIWENPPSSGDAGPGTFALITTAPNALVAEVHDRMPVILPDENLAPWLDPEPGLPEKLQPLLAPLPAELMTAWPVSPRMNNVRYEAPDCVEPVPPPRPAGENPDDQLSLGLA